MYNKKINKGVDCSYDLRPRLHISMQYFARKFTIHWALKCSIINLLPIKLATYYMFCSLSLEAAKGGREYWTIPRALNS